ncbi:MAG: IS1 family transposase [Gemmataceae bacterium]
MNKLPLERRVQVVNALIEGCSIRSTVRLTGVAKNTVIKLLVGVGTACREYQNRVMRNLPCTRLECDEIWSFCAMKKKNVPAEREGEFGIGDVWTWTAIDAETKLIPTWLVGLRNAEDAQTFVCDLAARLANRVQLTTDGLRVYIEAVEAAFGGAVDYAILHKIYGLPTGDESRYSPPQCIGCEKHGIVGQPDPELISTSYVERQNLTMRMKMRRFTRLTNAFSKKVENHAHAVALHFMHYNFARVHQTLRSTPAMRARVTDHLWSIEEIVQMTENERFEENGVPENNPVSN